MNVQHDYTVSQIQEMFQEQMPLAYDIQFKEISSDGKTIQILYNNNVCDTQKIQALIVTPFHASGSMQAYEQYLQSLPNVDSFLSVEDSLLRMSQGVLVVFLESTVYLAEVRKPVNQKISQAEIESTIHGPQNALSEDLSLNVSIIRHRYPNPSLSIERRNVGSLSATQIVLIYDEQFADKQVLDELKSRLSNLQLELLQSSGQLQNELTQKRRTLFPTMIITERPDRIVYNIARGKIIVLIDGHLHGVEYSCVCSEYPA